MEEFDDKLEARHFDNFQFVNFTKLVRSPSVHIAPLLWQSVRSRVQTLVDLQSSRIILGHRALSVCGVHAGNTIAQALSICRPC